VSGLRVSVERERCVGTGSCVLTEPAVFDQDQGDGRVIVLDPLPGAELRGSVVEAANLCPNAAIRFEDMS
jgi:ferredoxin